LSRYLFLAGSVPFLVLGTAHALLTPRSTDRPRPLSPADTPLAEAMARTPLRLTRRTDMWRAWVGFNFSHSLGVLLLGVVVVIVGRSEASFVRDGPFFVPLALAAALVYAVLAVNYWFRTPIRGAAAGAALFLAAWILLLVG
jgi:hypothetical protein